MVSNKVHQNAIETGIRSGGEGWVANVTVEASDFQKKGG